MDRINFAKIALMSSLRPPFYFENVKYGEGDSVPVDQQSIQDFNWDERTGMPMYDITALIRSDKLAQRDILARLTEFKTEFLPEDISDEDALKYWQPSLCQMPSELAEYTERVLRARIEEDLRAKGVEDEKELNTLLEKRLEEIKAKKVESKTD